VQVYLSPISSPFRQYLSVRSPRRNPITSISHSYSSAYHFFIINLQRSLVHYRAFNDRSQKKARKCCLRSVPHTTRTLCWAVLGNDILCSFKGCKLRITRVIFNGNTFTRWIFRYQSRRLILKDAKKLIDKRQRRSH